MGCACVVLSVVLVQVNVAHTAARDHAGHGGAATCDGPAGGPDSVGGDERSDALARPARGRVRAGAGPGGRGHRVAPPLAARCNGRLGSVGASGCGAGSRRTCGLGRGGAPGGRDGAAGAPWPAPRWRVIGTSWTRFGPVRSPTRSLQGALRVSRGAPTGWPRPGRWRRGRHWPACTSWPRGAAPGSTTTASAGRSRQRRCPARLDQLFTVVTSAGGRAGAASGGRGARRAAGAAAVRRARRRGGPRGGPAARSSPTGLTRTASSRRNSATWSASRSTSATPNASPPVRPTGCAPGCGTVRPRSSGAAELIALAEGGDQPDGWADRAGGGS